MQFQSNNPTPPPLPDMPPILPGFPPPAPEIEIEIEEQPPTIN